MRFLIIGFTTATKSESGTNRYSSDSIASAYYAISCSMPGNLFLSIDIIRTSAIIPFECTLIRLITKILFQPSNSASPVENEGGGLAGLAWHKSPSKISPGKSPDNSFKITLPTARAMDVEEGNLLDFLCQ